MALLVHTQQVQERPHERDADGNGDLLARCHEVPRGRAGSIDGREAHGCRNDLRETPSESCITSSITKEVALAHKVARHSRVARGRKHSGPAASTGSEYARKRGVGGQ